MRKILTVMFMTTEEYLKQRIKDLENNVCNSSLPLKFRKNQAFALLGYHEELLRLLNGKGH